VGEGLVRPGAGNTWRSVRERAPTRRGELASAMNFSAPGDGDHGARPREASLPLGLSLGVVAAASFSSPALRRNLAARHDRACPGGRSTTTAPAPV